MYTVSRRIFSVNKIRAHTWENMEFEEFHILKYETISAKFLKIHQSHKAKFYRKSKKLIVNLQESK